jgi:hypothetical protein
MLHHEEAAAGVLNEGGFHDAVRRPTTTTSVGRWQREMSVSDQRVAQVVAGDLLQELGYPVFDLGDLSASDRVRLSWLAAKYRLVESGVRAGQRLKMIPPR